MKKRILLVDVSSFIISATNSSPTFATLRGRSLLCAEMIKLQEKIKGQ